MPTATSAPALGGLDWVRYTLYFTWRCTLQPIFSLFSEALHLFAPQPTITSYPHVEFVQVSDTTSRHIFFAALGPATHAPCSAPQVTPSPALIETVPIAGFRTLENNFMNISQEYSNLVTEYRIQGGKLNDVTLALEHICLSFLIAFAGALILALCVLWSQSRYPTRQPIPLIYRRSTETPKQVTFNLKPGAANNLATSDNALPKADLQWQESATSEFQPTLPMITEDCEDEAESRSQDEDLSPADAAAPEATPSESSIKEASRAEL
jgi:hypothetical protein